MEASSWPAASRRIGQPAGPGGTLGSTAPCLDQLYSWRSLVTPIWLFAYVRSWDSLSTSFSCLSFDCADEARRSHERCSHGLGHSSAVAAPVMTPDETSTPSSAARAQGVSILDRGRKLDRRMTAWLWDADGWPSWLFLLVVALNLGAVALSDALDGGSFWAGVQTGVLFCVAVCLVVMALAAKRRGSVSFLLGQPPTDRPDPVSVTNADSRLRAPNGEGY